MKKKILILMFTSLSCYAQKNFDEIKTLDSKKTEKLLNKIQLINQLVPSYIYGYEKAKDEKAIKNLNLFLQNPFDRNIENFDLILALRKLDKVYFKIPALSSQVPETIKGGNQKDADGDGVPDILDNCPNTKGPLDNNGCPNAEETAIKALAGLTSVAPSGYSISTQIIDALATFLVERTKQELTLTFYENFKGKLDNTIYIKLNDNPKDSISIQLKDLFPDTYILFESKNYFETPSLGEVWLIAFKKDLNELPFKLEILIRKNANLKATNEGHLAVISFDIIKKLKQGTHPIIVLEELNESYNGSNNYNYEIDQVVSLLQLCSQNLSTEIPSDQFKEIKWINGDDLKKLSMEQQRYLAGLIYQMGRNNNLFKVMKLNNGASLEDYINEYNYNLFNIFIKKTSNNFNTINQKLDELKKNKEKGNIANELKEYADFLNTFYGLFDETLENYYSFINNDQYYQSDYYLKYKPIINDIVDYNTARADSNYAECWMITNRFINHLFPKYTENTKVLKEITFCGNFMVDVLNTAKNEGDLKVVIEKYAMPVSSYRIKRAFNSSWDVNAYPGLYLGYEFSGSNSVSYGVTAPIGISYSFKNKNVNNINIKSSSSTVFLSVIDIGAPFSYRFMNDEAQGLPEDIKWEQVFSPGLFYIYGFSNSPLSLGINAQFIPLLRKIEDNNQLESKNIFRIGLTLLVDIPLFNLTKS